MYITLCPVRVFHNGHSGLVKQGPGRGISPHSIFPEKFCRIVTPVVELPAMASDNRFVYLGTFARHAMQDLCLCYLYGIGS